MALACCDWFCDFFVEKLMKKMLSVAISFMSLFLFCADGGAVFFPMTDPLLKTKPVPEMSSKGFLCHSRGRGKRGHKGKGGPKGHEGKQGVRGIRGARGVTGL
jgi:hypothetical protein